MFHCPKCSSEEVRRSRTRSRWERWRRDITGKRPYRCRECDWRGWLESGLIPDQLASRGASAKPEAPNLRGSMLARNDPRRSVDIKKLDAFDNLPESGSLEKDDR